MAKKLWADRTILVTGASTGIGFAIASELGRLGAYVLAGARKDSDLENLNKLDNVVAVRLDVTRSEQIEEVVQHLKDLGRGLDVLINNAGIAITSPLMDLELDELRWQFEVNVFSIAALTKACFPLLQPCKGRIINISSMAGRMAMPFMGPYAMSKFALEAYTDSLRRELTPLGMEVIAIQPGPIQTPIFEKSAPDLSKFDGSLFEERVKRMSTKALETFAKQSLPAHRVTELVLHAICAARPRTRYVVSKGKWLRLALEKLPDRWVDAVLHRILR